MASVRRPGPAGSAPGDGTPHSPGTGSLPRVYDDFDTDDTRLEPDRLFGNLDGTLPHAVAPRIAAAPAHPAHPARPLHDTAAFPMTAMRDAPSETAFRPIPIPPPTALTTLPPPSWGRALGEPNAAAPWVPPVSPHAPAGSATAPVAGASIGSRVPWIVLGFALGVGTSVAVWLVLRF